MVDCAGTLGVDLRTRVKKKTQEGRSEGLDFGTSGVHAVGMAPTEMLKLRRQMAAAAGKKSTISLSLFMETCGLEVEEELSTLATRCWAEGVWTEKMVSRTMRSVDEAGSRGSNVETGERTRRSSHVRDP